METDLPEYNAALANAVKKRLHSEALVRKTRFSVVASRIFAIISVLGITIAVLSMFLTKPVSLDPEHLKSPEQVREEAAIKLGEAIGGVILISTALVCFGVSVLFARKWARTASESMAASETDNRKVLQFARLSGVPCALFLRGFEEEGRSLQSVWGIPFSTKRPDRATRWIEAEIIDQLDRRGMRTFCIANPSDTFLLPGAIRLLANPKAWLSEVRTLAKESQVIVIYLSSASQGLQIELDLLREESLACKTIVVATKKAITQNKVSNEYFPLTVTPPTLSGANMSAFGPILGRTHFQQGLDANIDRIVVHSEA